MIIPVLVSVRKNSSSSSNAISGAGMLPFITPTSMIWRGSTCPLRPLAGRLGQGRGADRVLRSVPVRDGDRAGPVGLRAVGRGRVAGLHNPREDGVEYARELGARAGVERTVRFARGDVRQARE